MGGSETRWTGETGERTFPQDQGEGEVGTEETTTTVVEAIKTRDLPMAVVAMSDEVGTEMVAGTGAVGGGEDCENAGDR